MLLMFEYVFNAVQSCVDKFTIVLYDDNLLVVFL